MDPWVPPPLPSRFSAALDLPFVGRRAELAALEAVWEEVERGRCELVFVGGEPGAGKTRLVAEVAGALAGRDVGVLVGSCSRDAGIPYEPFSEMLDRVLATVPAEVAARLVGDLGPQLGRLSVHHLPAPPGPQPVGGEARRGLFDAVAGFVRTLGAGRPLAVVVDDIHWAQLPTIALLEHLVQVDRDCPLLVLATFRTTTPDRSEEIAARIAELHRLEGVRRIDLGGLDTEAITEYVMLQSGLTASASRAPAALLRDLTGGNPFFLREVWADLEQRGGIGALWSASIAPASVGDTVAARLADLGEPVREVVELAAVMGETFELATLVAAAQTDAVGTMAAVDAACRARLVESADPHGRRYCFVHALTRSAVADRLAPSRRVLLHARVAEALERQPPDVSVVPRLAHHYLSAHVLGFHDQAVHYCREAGRIARRSLAFEDAAVWFERAASLPESTAAARSALLLAAAEDYVRACDFAHARAIYEDLATFADPLVGLEAALGFEDAHWRPGLFSPRAADLLSSALERCGLGEQDPRYVRALGALGRALALAGETRQARRTGGRAIALARSVPDDRTLLQVLTASLWHGTGPDTADLQYERCVEASRLAREAGDHETLGSVANFRAMVCYLLGRPVGLRSAVADCRRCAQVTGLPYYRFVHCCLAQAEAFLRGDFAAARQWVDMTVDRDGPAFGDEMIEGPQAVQLFMLHRETGELARFRSVVDGGEAFAGRWVPGLLALYTELGCGRGARRALDHLLERGLEDREDQAQWPMELVFLVEAALALDDRDALRALRPVLAPYGGRNIVSGTLIAVFGSGDRYLARVAAALGEDDTAERLFGQAVAADERMGSAVHQAETLAHQAVFLAARGRTEPARAAAEGARRLAVPNGHARVLAVLERLGSAPGPDGLTDREVEVLRLLAAGLSNQEIAGRLFISAHTAANHIRSILAKTRAANRTQAAMYAAHHELLSPSDQI